MCDEAVLSDAARCDYTYDYRTKPVQSDPATIDNIWAHGSRAALAGRCGTGCHLRLGHASQATAAATVRQVVGRVRRMQAGARSEVRWKPTSVGPGSASMGSTHGQTRTHAEFWVRRKNRHECVSTRERTTRRHSACCALTSCFSFLFLFWGARGPGGQKGQAGTHSP